MFNEWKEIVENDFLIEAKDSNGNVISVWQGFNDFFCLELNSKVIKSCKTWKPIEKKLTEFKGLEIISTI